MSKPYTFHGKLNRRGHKTLRMKMKAAFRLLLRPFIGREINQILLQDIERLLGSTDFRLEPCEDGWIEVIYTAPCAAEYLLITVDIPGVDHPMETLEPVHDPA